MSLLLEAGLRARARKLVEARGYGARADAILNESVASASSTPDSTFDVFLSHSIKDAEIVLGTVDLLSNHGHSVYVDWIIDRDLDRNNVNKKTAEKLRSRLRQCKSLLYLSSMNSPASKWMPWECGYKDGHNTRVAILPFAQTATNSFTGTEYLSLYPYVTEEMNQQSIKKLYVNENPTSYCLFKDWLNGENPRERTA